MTICQICHKKTIAVISIVIENGETLSVCKKCKSDFDDTQNEARLDDDVWGMMNGE